jgi:hypothetical protein
MSVTLGPVAFSGFEIDGGITFGGQQRLAVHTLANGTRIVDALGRDDREIGFRGYFSGADATLRARLLDSLRVQGAALPLVWDVFCFNVVVSRFEPDYRASNWIPFAIGCTVVQDEAGAAAGAAVDAISAVLSDVAAAAGYAGGAGIDLSAVAQAVTAGGGAAMGAFAFAASSLASASASAAATLPAALGAGDITAGLAALTAAGPAAQAMAQLSAASAYLARGALNFASR